MKVSWSFIARSYKRIVNKLQYFNLSLIVKVANIDKGLKDMTENQKDGYSETMTKRN